MNPLYVSLFVLAIMFLLIFLVTLVRTWRWGTGEKDTVPPLKGLAIPEGSIRGLIAFLVVGGFLIFAFFGKPLLSTPVEEMLVVDGHVVTDPKDSDKPVVVTKMDTSLFTTVLTAFGTLTGAVTGFYFGGRSTQRQATDGSGGGE